MKMPSCAARQFELPWDTPLTGKLNLWRRINEHWQLLFDFENADALVRFMRGCGGIEGDLYVQPEYCEREPYRAWRREYAAKLRTRRMF